MPLIGWGGERTGVSEGIFAQSMMMLTWASVGGWRNTKDHSILI